MAEHKAELEHAGVGAAAISVDPHEESKTLAAELRVGFPLLEDPGLTVATRWGVAMRGGDLAIPSVFVVQPDRAIVFSYIGEHAADRPSAQDIVRRAGEAAARGRTLLR